VKFILTKELGRLTKWLRILGFDAVYFVEKNRPQLIIESLREDRIILTRDRLIRDIRGVRVINIKHDNVKDQLQQLLTELDIKPEDISLFSRCLVCNKALESIAKEELKGKVPDYVYNTHEEFSLCKTCKRIYWQGSHLGKVKEIFEGIKK
jgi:uncharacterized protein with PIN domain